jgi:hypothetical protein
MGMEAVCRHERPGSAEGRSVAVWPGGSGPPTFRLFNAHPNETSPEANPVRRVAILLLLAFTGASSAAAQHPFSEDGSYDPRVPTPATILGYEPGERFTPHALLARYLERVAGASARVRLDTVAHTFEGRELFLAIVTSQANHQRLDEIKALARRVADPRGATQAELDDAVARLPAIVWLGYSVHGGEASGVEAGIAFLYQLAAGQDADTQLMLDSTVVLIDPVQNPDGHERHAQYVMRMRGALGVQSAPAALIHGGDWPGARTSHYYFDLNRDWFVQSHPETRGRTQTMLEWWPHTVVDLHEMGSSSTYYFAPPMDPVNKNVHETVWKWWEIYGLGNAAAFDSRGWSFFRREGYDDFYPGYGDSWPTFSGAAGMTYEQASSSGGAIRRSDGTVMTLSQATNHHYTASWSTVLTTARRRAERVRDYLTFRQTAITDVEAGPLRQIVIARDDDGRADSLVARLISDSVEVGILSQRANVLATAYGEADAQRTGLPAGSYVIDLAQPQGRLAKALLEPDAELDSAFIAEELENRRNARGDRFYDMTGWSLPYVFRADAWWVSTPVGPVDPIRALPARTVAAPPRATYGYAFAPGSERSIRMLASLLRDSVRVWFAPRSFRSGDAEFPDGAFIVRVAPNGESIHERVSELAVALDLEVAPLRSSGVDEGTDLGSNSVFHVRPPRIALAGESPISGGSFGYAWYTFDQRFQYPVTPISLGSAGGAALDDFDVLILPSASAGGINGELGENGRRRLSQWIRDGGLLITIDGATAWLADEDTGLSDFRIRRDTVRADSTGGAPLPSSVPGAIARTHGDSLSWMLAGVDADEVPVLYFSNRIYEAPDDLRAGVVVLRYADVDRLHLAGYMWPEVPERLAGAPYLWTESAGRGRVIGFTADPNFRDMWRGLLPIFANAVFLGASR